MFRFRTCFLSVVKTCVPKTTRHYRKFARQPVRVHLSTVDQAEQTLKQYENMVSRSRSNTYTNTKHKLRQDVNATNDLTSQQTVQKSRPEKKLPDYEVCNSSSDISQVLVNEIQFTHLKDARNFIRSMLNNINSRKFRDENKLFVVEGFRIVKEALDAGITPEAIFFSRLCDIARLKSAPSGLELKELNALNELPLYKTPYKNLQMRSSLTTCPGIIGVFKRPDSLHTSLNLPLTVILDEIREPGNIGGILRTVAAVGIDHVILMKGCCDPWESKVLRAACGAHFRVKLTPKVTWDTIRNYIPEDASLLLADMCQDRDYNENVQLKDSAEIPLVKNHKSEVNENEKVGTYEIDSDGNKIFIDSMYNNEALLSQFKNVKFPLHYYDDFELSRKIFGTKLGAFLIIGGEIGISNAAKMFSYNNGGIQVAVPLANGMDSLNMSVAAGIILYEIQRQYHHYFCHEQHEEP